MRVLLTSTRAPVTLELARAFAREGHPVVGVDTFPLTIGAWSNAVERHCVVPSPRFEREAFVDGLSAIAKRECVDLIVPTCEEVFAVGYGRDRLERVAHVLVAEMATLATLHDKWSFTKLAESLGIRVPESALATSGEELREACDLFGKWIAKPVYSRFATRIASNAEGFPSRTTADVRPSPDEPWIVQRFVDGDAECSYSVVYDGRIAAHVAYATPVRHGAGSGVRFASVDGGPTLEVAAAIARATGFTGSLSFDFIRGQDGLTLLECNPRVTSGVHLMGEAELVRALTEPTAPLHVVPAGLTRQLLFPAMASLASSLRGLGRAARAVRFGDVVMQPGDRGAALAQVPMTWHFLRVARRERLSLAAATTHDIEWNGDGR